MGNKFRLNIEELTNKHGMGTVDFVFATDVAESIYECDACHKEMTSDDYYAETDGGGYIQFRWGQQACKAEFSGTLCSDCTNAIKKILNIKE